MRLLRDGVVIHQGELTQLKRFKDDVKEVARGYECGMSFANFNDIREGDMVECYETRWCRVEARPLRLPAGARRRRVPRPFAFQREMRRVPPP